MLFGVFAFIIIVALGIYVQRVAWSRCKKHETLDTLKKYVHWERLIHTRCMVRARILWNAIHQSRRSKCIPEKIVSSDWVQQRSLARTHHYRATHTAEGSSCGWYPYAKPETERRRPFHFWSEQYRADSRMDFLQSKSHSKSRLKRRSSEIYKQKRFSFCFLSFPFFFTFTYEFFISTVNGLNAKSQ